MPHEISSSSSIMSCFSVTFILARDFPLHISLDILVEVKNCKAHSCMHLLIIFIQFTPKNKNSCKMAYPWQERK